jgi:hypothetical protein
MLFPLSNSSMPIDSAIWFVPLDIVMLILAIFVIICGLLLLVFLLFDRTCRTASTLLLSHSCIVGIFFALVMFHMTLFTLQRDLQQRAEEDALCIFRGYLDYCTAALQNHSFALHAVHRYMTVVHPSFRLWQSIRFQTILIMIKWIFFMSLFVPLLWRHDIRYNSDNQICQIPLTLPLPALYVTFLIFVSPVTIIIVVYYKLLRYVRSMGQHITPVNRLFRTKRQLKMIRRICVLINALLFLALPYTTFIVLSFVTVVPKYHFRIIFAFIYVASSLMMCSLFSHTNTARRTAVKFFHVLFHSS